jgi:acetyltransferase-like isoleucine patch superfamily enzyme
MKIIEKLKEKYRLIKVLGMPLYITNIIFKNLLRIDSDFRYNKNYTSRILFGKKIKVENNSFSVLRSFAASGGCYIQAAEGIEIGEGTIWSFNVSLISLDHDLSDFSKKREKGPLIIGKHCWIGAGVVILPGVRLGDNTIVGANSVVTKPFMEGNVIIAGCPAIIKRNI